MGRQLEELLEEQSRHWRQGQGRPVEDYLSRQPTLGQDIEVVLDLVYHEVLLRRQRGELPSLAEYRRRFPQMAEQLAPLFEVYHALQPGELTLPGYEVLREVGRGGMGVVYEARQLGLNRTVALKMILAGGHAGAEERARFRREAEAAARLQHPHIIQVYEVGEAGDRPFIALEYLAGGSLADRLGGGPLPAREAAQLVQALAGAVHAAHRGGVVHRDLKPANVLLTADGTPKVTDFGLAKRLDSSTKQTATGAILGTPGYMAPEQAGGRGHEVGPAADVYALGAILYECLTGRPPFRAATPLETMLQVLTEEPVPPTRLRPGVPADLETVCLTCLAKEPARRYASAEALAEDLGRFLAGEPIRARPLSGLEWAIRWARRRPALAAAYVLTVLALLLGGLGAGATWLWQRAETARREATHARYLYQVALAQRAWQDAHVARAEELLTECDPRLRNWEWRYVRRLCHADLLTLRGHTGEVHAVAFSPDGRYLSTRGADGVKVWDLETGREAVDGAGRAATLNDVVRAGGRELTAAANGRAVQVRDARTGQDLWTLDGHTETVYGVAFSPDGTRLASAGADETVKVWELPAGTEPRVLRRPLLDLHGHTAPVRAVAFSPDGNRLASAGADETVAVWQLPGGRQVLSLRGHTDWVLALAFSPDGRRLASAGRDAAVKVWDATTGQEARTLSRHTGPVNAVAFSPDGQVLASASADGTVRLWGATTGREGVTLRGHTDKVWGVAFSPDGRLLASAGADRAVRLWDVATGGERRCLVGHTSPVYGVAFSPDGTRLASAAKDGTVTLWDVPGGREVLTFRGPADAVYGVAFSPDGRRLAGAGGGGTVTVWDATTGQDLLRFPGHTAKVYSVAFSPDGRRLATASLDRTVRVWDAGSGRLVRTLKGHTRSVTAVAFSPDGSRLASGSWDKTLKVWDAQTGEEVLTLQGHRDTVWGVAFSPDGNLLASAGADHTVRVWDATPLE
jgi:WD40 repeat protein